jgi:nucleotide-binding universal stress UspA family protein
VKDLLVLATTLPPTGVLDWAATLATRTDAALSALYCCEPVDILFGTSLPAAGGLVAAWHQDRVAHARQAAPAFEIWAGQRGISHSAWLVAQGPLGEAASFAANWHDALIVQRDDASAWGTVNAIGQLVVSVGIPVLVLPPGYAEPARLERIAIAWNGSPESTRAVHAALPLLRRARDVVLMSGQRRTPFSALLEAPPFDAAGYLQRHGIAFAAQDVDAADDHGGPELLARAAAVRADLLVMGGYGRSRFSEWILGGVTRHVLREAKLPVLMRH